MGYSKVMDEKGYRTANLTIELHKKLMQLKFDLDFESLPALLEELYDFYKKNKKIGAGK